MKKTIIIGGGISGLTAAYYLQQARVPYTLIEASDRVGGRVRSDFVDGYTLDRGFQVFLTAYPEAQAVLDYSSLQLKTFRPGAQILLRDGSTCMIGDPLRDIRALSSTLSAPVASIGDMWRILRLKNRLKGMSIDEVFGQVEQSTARTLRDEYGFSDHLVDEFFMPFYKGIFLEDDLSTSRRMFDFVFKMFSSGDAAIPAGGIEIISKQIASNLAKHDIHCGSPVDRIDRDKVYTKDGDSYDYDHIILATDGPSTARLLSTTPPKQYRSTTTAYFASDVTCLPARLITLQPNGIVNNLCDLTSVSPHLAPKGKVLHSVTLRSHAGDAKPTDITQEVCKWYPAAAKWQHLKTYKIEYALPNQTSVANTGIKVQDQTIICGDHLLNGSVNAAMKSGRLAAEHILASR